jgi:hypothetical protein
VSWTEAASTDGSMRQLAHDLGGILQAYGDQWSTWGCPCNLSGRGASSAMAFQSGYLAGTAWRAVALFGGVPDGDWTADGNALAAAVSLPAPLLYYLIGDGDPEYAQAAACVTALRARGMHVADAVVSGSITDAVVNFSAIYQYLVA